MFGEITCLNSLSFSSQFGTGTDQNGGGNHYQSMRRQYGAGKSWAEFALAYQDNPYARF